MIAELIELIMFETISISLCLPVPTYLYELSSVHLLHHGWCAIKDTKRRQPQNYYTILN